MDPERRWMLDEDGVRTLGRALGGTLAPGDVVALTGPLGAGKSVLARAMVYGAGVPGSVRVASPTFTIVQEYAGRLPVHHADLYRLAHASELDEIGLFERALDAALVVEWADRFPSQVPADALWIELAHLDATTRALRAHGAGARVARLLAAAG